MDLYIYYRAACPNEQALQARVAAMQARLAADHGVAAALKRRPEAKDGRHTWMEVYPSVPEGFAACVASAVRDAKLDELIDGERHVEFFMDIRACA